MNFVAVPPQSYPWANKRKPGQVTFAAEPCALVGGSDRSYTSSTPGKRSHVEQFVAAAKPACLTMSHRLHCDDRHRLVSSYLLLHELILVFRSKFQYVLKRKPQTTPG